MWSNVDGFFDNLPFHAIRLVISFFSLLPRVSFVRLTMQINLRLLLPLLLLLQLLRRYYYTVNLTLDTVARVLRPKLVNYALHVQRVKPPAAVEANEA